MGMFQVSQSVKLGYLNVTTMFNMFQSATVFNQDITNFNVSNVTAMNGMFQMQLRLTMVNQPVLLEDH